MLQEAYNTTVQDTANRWQQHTMTITNHGYCLLASEDDTASGIWIDLSISITLKIGLKLKKILIRSFARLVTC